MSHQVDVLGGLAVLTTAVLLKDRQADRLVAFAGAAEAHHALAVQHTRACGHNLGGTIALNRGGGGAHTQAQLSMVNWEAI